MKDHANPDPQPEPPHSIDAEQAVLGAILINNEAYDRVSGMLTPEHFYDPVHSRIYEATATRITEGKLASPVMLKPIMAADAGLKELGGGDYLARMVDAVVSVAAVRDYAEMIVDMAHRRAVIAAAEEAAERARDIGTPIDDVLDEAETGLDTVRGEKTGNQRAVTLSQALEEAAREAESAIKGETGNKTGLVDLDSLLGGMFPGDLSVVAGRPGMGKSAVSLWLAEQQASQGRPVLYCGLEMRAAQNALRLVSEWTARSGRALSYGAIRRGEISHRDFMHMLERMRENETLPVHMTGPDLRGLGALISEIRRFSQRCRHQEKEPGLVVIDYLSLITQPSGARSIYEWISSVTPALKSAAQRYGVPLILCAQLSRALERRDDKRPVLADLRDSGSIEQDADNVLFLYRDRYYAEREEPDPASDAHAGWEARMARGQHKLEIIVAKQRYGETGTVTVGFNPGINHLWDLGRHGEQRADIDREMDPADREGFV